MITVNDNTIVFTSDDVEQDITLVLPDGQKIILQYRSYDYPHTPPTIDFCMDKHVFLVNWSDDEMTPAIPNQYNPNQVDSVKHFMMSFNPS